MDQNSRNLKVEVIDNFLPYEEFKKISEYVTGGNFMWYFNKTITDKRDEDGLNFYFTHVLYSENNITSKDFNFFKPLFDKLNIKKLIRTKLNLYTKTNTIEEHKEHVDFKYEHNNCLFSFNTCDGYTILNKEYKVKSIENRAILFNGLIPHQSTSCTDARARVNININYL